MPQGRWVLVRPPGRPRRHAARPLCPARMKWIEGARRCCTLCPAGEGHLAGAAWHSVPGHTGHVGPDGRAPRHLTVPAGTFLRSPCSNSSNDGDCTPCPAGTFSARPNTFPECQACYECDRQGEPVACRATPCRAVQRRTAPCLSSAAFQSVLSNCSATSNVACGCEPGRFRDCLDERCSEFSCRQCQPCTGRLIQRPCECCRPACGVPPPAALPLAVPPCLTPALSPGSEAQDALCGSCKPDFYAEGGECRPCSA